ncbi:MAG: hypothetical protein M1830_005514, partial [Pleopsidium flavum]
MSSGRAVSVRRRPRSIRGKRKLVSLNDANEVSKRLAKKKSKQSDVKDKNQNGEEKASGLKDE